MTTTLYVSAAMGLLNAAIDTDANTWKVLAVDAGYVYDPTDDNLDDVAAGARVGSVTITGRTITAGVDGTSAVLTADDVLIPTGAGDVVTGLIIYRHTGTESTSTLIAYIDTTEEGVPIGLTTTTDGIVVPWSADGLLVIGTA